jgi:hypothetical protein
VIDDCGSSLKKPNKHCHLIANERLVRSFSFDSPFKLTGHERIENGFENVTPWIEVLIGGNF